MMEFLGDVLYDLKEFSDTRFEVVALFRMIVASICGGLIGLEREMKGRPAGLKTFSLVCIGATLAMITNEYISRNFGGSGDLARMAAQVISGIGFLGAGTIIVTGTNQVRGLTTAAALWVTAALGISIGAGFYFGAFGGVAVIFTSSMTCKMIDRMVALSGLTKQEYILRKLMDWEVTVQGNPRVYKALKNQMQQIYGELKRLEVCSEENEELLQTIQMVAVTLNGMKEEPQHVESSEHP